MEVVSPTAVDSRRLTLFFVVLGLLALVRASLGFVALPIAWVPALSLIVTAFFVFVPIVALFRVAGHAWTPRLAAGFLVGGLLAHATFTLTARGLLGGAGVGAAILEALGQTGLLVWCLGLGGLLATLIREKNMLLPVAFFLAAFDIFLVLTPAGPTRQILESSPQILEAIAYHVPQVATEVTHGTVATMAYVGPADFLFLGAFFIALYRFRMQVKRTFYWIVPTLIAYLLTVVVFGHVEIGAVSLGALPALVPIGAVVLLANAREFHLSRDEKIATAVVAALAIGLVVWGATRPVPAPTPETVPNGPMGPLDTPTHGLVP